MYKQPQHIKALLQACKNGKQPAQFEIYKLYYKAMYNIALRMMKDSFEAEDIMQEAFLNAFTKLDSFKGEVTFGAWLKRIVINKCLTQLKKNSRFDEVKLELVENKVSFENEDLLKKEYSDFTSLKAKAIITMINRLKDNYRIALNLSLIEGYDNEEISKIMEISNENCRTTISRAKNKLRTLLAESTMVK